MAQNNREYRPPLSGPQFEVLIAQQKYEELSKQRYIIEPNLRFYGNIAPSTIDFLAEFDLFIYKSDNTSHLIELKARPVSEYDLYKFEIQTKRTGLIKSNLEYITTNPKRNLVKNLASNLGIIFSRRNLEANAKNEPTRKYIDSIIKNEEKNHYLLYLKYHQAALHSHPGYYILLNNCWIPQYSKRKDIIKKVKDVLKIILPQTSQDNRKILEFIYIKAHLLYNWLVINSKNVTTHDIIDLIKHNSNRAIKLNQNTIKFKRTIEDEIGSKLQIDKNLNKKYKKGEYISVSTKPTKTLNLYVVIGNDKYIKKSLPELINQIRNLFYVENVFLIHTRSEPSKDVADTVYNKLRGKFNINPPIDYLYGTNDNIFDLSEFIKFIDGKADKDSALLVTYIPKSWALTLHFNREKWKYFFFIDRPEFIQKVDPDNPKSPSIDLKAFELNNR